MIYVIYHKNCNDGTASAMLVDKFVKGKKTFIDLFPGDPVPDMPDCEFLYIVDYSFKRDIILELHKKYDNNKVVVLDHHKTARTELEGLPNCFFDMSKCGATMVWNHFTDKPVPKFIQYIEDYDLYTKKLDHIDAITTCLHAGPRTIDQFKHYLKEFENKKRFSEFVVCGGDMLVYRKSQIELQAQFARRDQIDGVDCMVVNAPASFSSDLGEYLYNKYPDVKFVCIYYDLAEGYRCYSLRSKGDFDVTTIAKKYGGGGHKNAAGFHVKTPAKLFY